MLKLLAILAIAVLLATGMSSQPSKGVTKDKGAPIASPQPDSQNDNQDGQKTPSIVVQVGTQQADTAETKEKKDNDRNLAIYTLLLAVFTAVLAIVSIGQGYFLRQQSHHLQVHGVELRRLASAARDNAEAAKSAADFALLNAKAVINAERAWIMVQPTSHKREVYTFTAGNVGQTPAKLIRSFGTL
jgi:hypothetical protein